MAYQVLALKLRPQNFDQIIGQDAVVKTLKNAIATDRIPHAFIFSGIRGVGKTSTARILAKALNCKDGPTPQPCNKCSNCREISLGSSVDVIELDAASNRGIDEIRDIRSKAKYPPLAGKYKIYILDESHMLTTQAFNALLKTLEEPPPYIIFILSTTEFHKLPPTIISRCQHFDFRRIPHSLILGHLGKIAEEEKLKVEDASLALIATAAEGSLRDAQRSLDQIISFSGKKILYEDVVSILGIISHEILLSLTKGIIEHQPAELVKLIDQLITYGYEPHQICHQLIGHLRNLLLFKVIQEPAEMISLPEEEYQKLKQQASSLTQVEIMRLLDMLLQEEKGIRYSSQARFELEALLMRMALLDRLLPVEELVKRMERLEGRVTPPPQPREEEKIDAEAISAPAEPELFQESAPSARAEEGMPPEDTPPEAAKPGLKEATPEYEAPSKDKSLEEQILTAIKEQKASLFHLINFASSISVEDSTLILSFSQKNITHKEMVEDKSNLELLKRIASKIANREMEVKIISSAIPEKEAKQMQGKDLEEPKSKELEKRALSQPMFKAFLDVFKGKIVEIDDLKEES